MPFAEGGVIGLIILIAVIFIALIIFLWLVPLRACASGWVR